MADLLRERRSDRLFRHCLYGIATGKWEPGHRLPSVREAAARFGVDRRTVLEAYARLEQTGLLRRAARAGFFVARDAAHDRVARHRHELERIYEETVERVRETGLSPLGALRWLAWLAAMRAADRPECAFVECTRDQADAHAAEVSERLAVPCCGLTLAQLGGRVARVPPHVRTLLVSAFHAGELGEIAAADGLRTLVVPIAVAPSLRDAIPATVREAVLVELHGADAHDMAADVATVLPGVDVRWQACAEVDAELAVLLGAVRRDVAVLLSPRVWGSVAPSLRADPRVRPVAFTVHASAWQAVADAVGLPLGDVA